MDPQQFMYLSLTSATGLAFRSAVREDKKNGASLFSYVGKPLSFLQQCAPTAEVPLDRDEKA